MAGLVHEGGQRQTSWDTWDATYARSEDGGLTWSTDDLLEGLFGFNEMIAVASNHGDGGATYAWDLYRLHRSYNGGPLQSIDQDPVTSAVIDPADPLRLYAVRLDGLVRLTTDGGDTWVLRSGGLWSTSSRGTLFMDPSSADRLALSYGSLVSGSARRLLCAGDGGAPDDELQGDRPRRIAVPRSGR